MALRRLLAAVERLCSGEAAARQLRDGHLVVFAGAPNVGKSSLFNALLGADRAIVTPIAGTTRDLVSEHVLVAGTHVCLVDTAGVRVAADAIEAEGIRRAEAVMAEADLVVVVMDRSRDRNADDRRVLEMTSARPRVVVANKGDRPSAADGERDADLVVSASTSVGIDTLAACVGARLAVAAAPDDVVVTSARQRALLAGARASLAHAAAALDAQFDDLPEEFLAADVERAQVALEELIGRRAPDDLLAEIFSRFCIGK
jgi:tRNA modification GTPase